jgi:hypothetical protein
MELRPAARLPAPSPRPAEPADGVRVRILSGLVRVCAVALLAGCSMMIDTHKGPAPDWPELRIVEHHVSSAAMREVCVRAQPWFAFGMVDACVYWRFATSWSTSGCTARGTTTPARTRRGGRGRPTSRGAVVSNNHPKPRGYSSTHRTPEPARSGAPRLDRPALCGRLLRVGGDLALLGDGAVADAGGRLEALPA